MVRLALKIFCRNLTVSNREALQIRGALLLVANHPNSFLDAIVIGSQFKETVHFLARGDAFHKPWHAKLLRMLNMIPVYRLSEGRENLFLNDAAFARSKEVLSQNGIVLIFIEGICVHKHQLQPFKKGAARIAMDSKSLLNFRIMPLGIAYDSFTHFGKKINIKIGDAMETTMLLPYEDAAQNFRYFNAILYNEINKRILIPKRPGSKQDAFLFLPAVVGLLLHAPIYYFIKSTIRKKTKGTVFYDSVLFGVLLLIYPGYLFLLGLLLNALGLTIPLVFILLLLHPLSAWASVHKQK
jgi:1-acyl-sn-glycerol-3-phosphate acyltransferase